MPELLNQRGRGNSQSKQCKATQHDPSGPKTIEEPTGYWCPDAKEKEGNSTGPRNREAAPAKLSFQWVDKDR